MLLYHPSPKSYSSNSMPVHKKAMSAMQCLTMLPQSVLELIFNSDTSIGEKKSLRQTCKFFKEISDGSLICLKVTLEEKDQQHAEKLFRRMHHLHAVSIRAWYGVDSLLQHLPEHITTLTIYGDSYLNLEQLSRLRCLTALNLFAGSVSGLQDIAGLTSLYCHRRVGSLAHLAPTLKQLTVEYDTLYPLNIDQLTNLEALHLYNMPHNFFEEHSKLPLKHFSTDLENGGHLVPDDEAWLTAPTTLTRLSLRQADKLPDALPATITHLQLLNPVGPFVEQALTILPGLQRLDVSFSFVSELRWCSEFTSVSKHTNLQELGIHVSDTTWWEVWQSNQVSSELPGSEVARAVERGLKLNVVAYEEELLFPFDSPFFKRSIWTSHTLNCCCRTCCY